MGLTQTYKNKGGNRKGALGTTTRLQPRFQKGNNFTNNFFYHLKLGKQQEFDQRVDIRTQTEMETSEKKKREAIRK